VVRELAGVVSTAVAGGAVSRGARGRIKTNTNTILETVKRNVTEDTIAARPPIPRTDLSWESSAKAKVGERSPDYTEFQSETALKLQDEARKLGIEFTAEVPFQQRMSMVEQARNADKFVTENPAAAERMLFKDETPPQGIMRESLYKAVERRALAESNPTLIDYLV
jgi:hypothetical protein